MQLITEHPNVPSAAFYIVTSNCHLLIQISFIYVLLIRSFFFYLNTILIVKELIISVPSADVPEQFKSH